MRANNCRLGYRNIYNNAMENRPEEFDQLRRLLALKRHEVPPPGFFDRLPNQIMARIEREPSSRWEEMLDRLLAISWFQTAASGAMAVLVGGLLVLAMTQPAGNPVSPSGAALHPSSDTFRLTNSSSTQSLNPVSDRNR